MSSGQQSAVFVERVDPNKHQKCPQCFKEFAKKAHLQKHLIRHDASNKRHFCQYCSYASRDRYELVRHTKRLHTGDFVFRCENCGKGFMRKERYLTHLRWHSGERPFQCVTCHKGFRDSTELVRHSRQHTGDLPYKCDICGKKFLRRERYVTHVRIHTGEKPFTCSVCPKSYRDKRELAKHQRKQNHATPEAFNPATVPLPPSVATALKVINATDGMSGCPSPAVFTEGGQEVVAVQSDDGETVYCCVLPENLPQEKIRLRSSNGGSSSSHSTTVPVTELCNDYAII